MGSGLALRLVRYPYISAVAQNLTQKYSLFLSLILGRIELPPHVYQARIIPLSYKTRACKSATRLQTRPPSGFFPDCEHIANGPVESGRRYRSYRRRCYHRGSIVFARQRPHHSCQLFINLSGVWGIINTFDHCKHKAPIDHTYTKPTVSSIIKPITAHKLKTFR